VMLHQHTQQGMMYADHRRTIAAQESCCDNTINLHKIKIKKSFHCTIILLVLCIIITLHNHANDA